MQNDPDRGQTRLAPKEATVPLLRVLIVDDEPAVRGALTTSLSQRGFSVLTAPDLRSAMRVATTHRPDVILLDVRLGGDDGLKLVQLLRAAGLAIPCVVLTGHAGPYEGFKAKEMGIVDLIQKPSSPDKIAGVLRRVVMETRAANVVLSAGAGNSPNIEHDKPSISRHAMLRFLSTEHRSGRADDPGAQHICKALEVIDRRFIEIDFSVSDLAMDVGVSAEYLARLFGKRLGRSPLDCIQEVRVAAAERLLKNLKARRYLINA